MKHLDDKVAAVTGAGGGIGRALALDLAGRGCRLALSDVSADGLEATTAAVRESGDLPQRLAQCARTGQSFVVSCQVRLGRLFEDKSAQPRQPILVAGNVVVDARERVGAVVVMSAFTPRLRLC